MKVNRFQGFGLRTVRAFARSIVLALNTFDRIELIHGDLKPENIVLQHEGRTNLKVISSSLNILFHIMMKIFKVIDFGSSCYEGSTHFTYVQSRYYRAPEVNHVHLAVQDIM